MSYSIGSHFDAQRWYDTTIDKRTREALRSRIAEFELEHENDSDTDLLILIRARAHDCSTVWVLDKRTKACKAAKTEGIHENQRFTVISRRIPTSTEAPPDRKRAKNEQA